MSGFRNPVGDEPPETYWRRRLILLGVVVLAILLLWFLISATLADDGDGKASDPDSSPETTLSPEANAAPDAGDPDRPCTTADLAISTVPSPSNVNVGASAAFDVTVEHTGASACALSSDGDGTSMVIRSGPDVYLDSAWCADTPVFDETNWILQPGDREVVQATWNTKRYNESCEPGAGGKAGKYWVAMSVAGVDAEEVDFFLVD